jgi:hypothetical protein
MHEAVGLIPGNKERKKERKKTKTCSTTLEIDPKECK